MKKVTDLKENECIHCRTKEEFKAILELNPSNTCKIDWWDNRKDNTIYYPKRGVGKGNVNSFWFATQEKHTIHHASDFLNPTYQLTIPQIIKIAKNGNLIKELFPECFEVELKVDKWYKFNKFLLYIIDKTHWYGFDELGLWVDFVKYENLINDKDLTPATEEEITEALINEAKRRGFEGNERLVWEIDGVRFLSSKPKLSTFKYKKQNNILTFACGTVFNNGKWAKLIQTPTEVIKIIETYGKDKLITLIEAYARNNK